MGHSAIIKKFVSLSPTLMYQLENKQVSLDLKPYNFCFCFS